MLKAIALSLAFLLSFGVVVPLMTDHSEASAKHKNKKKRKKIKKYSKAWWRIYRAKQKRKRALAARKRALKARQARLAARADRPSSAPELVLSNDAAGQPTRAVVKVAGSRVAKADKNAKNASAQEFSQPGILPSGESAPTGWKRNSTAVQGDAQFKVSDNGAEVGSADLKVVSPAVGADNDQNPRNKTVGGVSTAALRRTVIDKMIKEQGWVVNDYQKEMNGKKVYVVVAQSQVPGSAMQSRVFYFMEADGRVYSLATSAPVERSEKLAHDSEKVLDSLNRANRPLQASAGAAAATLR
jgi:hypothetical protein